MTSHDDVAESMPALPKALARWLSTGAAKWTGGKPSLQPPVALPSGGGQALSDTVIEDRG